MSQDDYLKRCMFCQADHGPFNRVEHPIPESLGNDDIVLPPGTVCDPCNQYFGSKVEQPVLNLAPFGIERVGQAVRNKKGVFPREKCGNVELQSTGHWDSLVFRSEPPHRELTLFGNGKAILCPSWTHSDLLVRFLLKVGLGLLATRSLEMVHGTNFDAARRCARYGQRANLWDFAYGIYPDRDALVTGTRFDELGRLETRQLYQFSLGIISSGDVMFNFVYATSVFAVNLSRPPATEYIMEFNVLNPFAVESRWNLDRTFGRKPSVFHD